MKENVFISKSCNRNLVKFIQLQATGSPPQLTAPKSLRILHAVTKVLISSSSHLILWIKKFVGATKTLTEKDTKTVTEVRHCFLTFVVSGYYHFLILFVLFYFVFFSVLSGIYLHEI